ncbi:putative exostosin [Helianthus anomalus]
MDKTKDGKRAKWVAGVVQQIKGEKYGNVSPLVGLRDHGFVAGQAITKVDATKVAKHEKACIENQHVFVSFAFDTFGALAPDVVRFLKRVQQVVNSNTTHVKRQNFVFSKVGFAIQKGVAAQLVARLLAISL